MIITALLSAALMIPVPAAGCEGRDATPPCRYDDGSLPSSGQGRCVWDAKHMGNGQGKSFLAIHPTDGADPDIIRIKHRKAHRLMTTCA